MARRTAVGFWPADHEKWHDIRGRIQAQHQTRERAQHLAWRQTLLLWVLQTRQETRPRVREILKWRYIRGQL